MPDWQVFTDRGLGKGRKKKAPEPYNAHSYGRHELAESAGVTVHCISAWVRRGVIPKAHGYGRWAWYDDEHLEAINTYIAKREAVLDRPHLKRNRSI